MKSPLKSILLLLLLAVLSVAVSCSSSSPTPTPGSTGGNTSTSGGVSCGAGLTACNGSCVSTSTDSLNCGGCSNQCSTGQSCQVAVCRCQGALTDCGGACVSLQGSHQNCGTCSNACDAASVCDFGVCAAGCSAGLTNCNGGCTNPLSDPFNCGVCGTQCGAGQACSAGSCVCSDGSPVCNGQCTNVMSDNANCGGCGVVCSVGQNCASGTCQGGAVTVTGSTGMTTSTTTAGATTSTTAGTATTGVGGATSTGATTTATATTGSSNGTPAGWWTYTPLSWAGCAWTGIDTVVGSNTTVMPQDFTTLAAGESYCVQGTVGADYDAVSLLGFNLAEDAATANCTYDPTKATSMGPPGVALSGSGIAVNLTKSTGATLRVQIQGPNGATVATDRWCATITGVQGKVFVPYSDFNTECWEGGNGVSYNSEPISAVVFLVPGALNPTPYNYCIHGFATGTTADDAPDGGGDGGPLTGTIGGAGADDLDFQRVKVAAGGKSYIIQNNNWGNPAGTNQVLSYSDNSFVVQTPTGGEPGGGAPASFPSIFIGANGDTQNGTYSTSSDDNLPIVVSTIQSVMTTFTYNRANGDYNAAYDVWFSANNPMGQAYDDGISGFVMLWLYKPPNHHPIGWGTAAATGVSLAGRTWDVYVGPRDGGAYRPVVNYVATSTIMGMENFDLMEFIDNAEQHGINQSWYLTDVFGGFEIWNGGGTEGLALTEFTAVVQ